MIFAASRLTLTNLFRFALGSIVSSGKAFCISVMAKWDADCSVDRVSAG